jgi:magnesium chelatase family protein
MTCTPPWGSDTARAYGAAVAGAEGHPIQVTAQISNGLADLQIHGMPEARARQAHDRIRAAVLNSSLPWPERTITVGLHPEALTGPGCGLDLAIAVAIVAAAGVIPAKVLEGYVFASGLGLDGSLRPVCGAVAAQQAAAEAAAVPGITVLACHSLRDLIPQLRTGPVRRPDAPALAPPHRHCRLGCTESECPRSSGWRWKPAPRAATTCA